VETASIVAYNEQCAVVTYCLIVLQCHRLCTQYIFSFYNMYNFARKVT